MERGGTNAVSRFVPQIWILLTPHTTERGSVEYASWVGQGTARFSTIPGILAWISSFPPRSSQAQRHASCHRVQSSGKTIYVMLLVTAANGGYKQKHGIKTKLWTQQGTCP